MKSISMRVHLLLVLCLALLLLLLLVSVQRFDANQPLKVHYLLERVSHLDTQSEQSILQVYSRSRFDYDQMSSDLAEMHRVFGELTVLLAGEEAFAAQLEALAASIQIQGQGVSEFKSAYAILSNSLRYMPTLTQQIQSDYPELHGWLTALNRDVFQWNIYPNDRHALFRISQAMNTAGREGLHQLHRHLKTIIDYSPLVIDAIETVTTCGTSENARLLSDAYDRHFAIKVEDNQRHQIWLVILGVVLLLYLLLLLVARQKAAVRLGESEARFQMLFDLIPDGVGVHSNERWIYCNPALLEMFSAPSADDLIGTDVLERVHPDQRDQIKQRIRDEIEQMQPAPLLLEELLRLDGSSFYAEVQGIPFIENGKPVAMSVVRDVTDRVRAQREAEKSRQNLQAVIDNSPAALYQKDMDGRYILANRYYGDLLGISVEAMVGKTDHDLFPANMAEKFCSDDVKVTQAGCAMEFEEVIEIEGERRTFISIKVPLRDDNGDVESLFGISTDITALINAEREKAEAQTKLEHVQRLESLGILAGGIAHDFNNILTAVMGNAAMAYRSIEDSSPAKEFLSRIEASTQRAADLCKQMLAYSGKGKFIIKSIDLSQLVEDMTRLMEVSIEKNVVIKYHLAENLPAIEVDSAQVQQVILNLITNANESIESKSGVISFTTGVMHADKSYLQNTISTGDIPEGRYVFLEVSDTGHGMDKQTLKKIFDPFFTTKFTGRGLGMSAVLGIVRGHQGALRVYSEVGKGTTFKVLFPVSSSAVVLADDDKALTQEPWRGEGTILVVDDEETIREVAAMMLEDMGFQTIGAENGLEALHLYQKFQHEIVGVLLDMTMPKMEGGECFSELRRINPDVKVVLSSGYNEQDVTNRFVGKGLAGFVQKPYTPEELQEKVRHIFD